MPGGVSQTPSQAPHTCWRVANWIPPEGMIWGPQVDVPAELTNFAPSRRQFQPREQDAPSS